MLDNFCDTWYYLNSLGGGGGGHQEKGLVREIRSSKDAKFRTADLKSLKFQNVKSMNVEAAIRKFLSRIRRTMLSKFW